MGKEKSDALQSFYDNNWSEDGNGKTGESLFDPGTTVVPKVSEGIKVDSSPVKQHVSEVLDQDPDEGVSLDTETAKD